MTVLSTLLPILAPVLITAAIGYVWALMRLEHDAVFVTRVVIFVGTPCLAFDSLTRYQLSVAELGQMFGLAGVVILLSGLLGGLALAARRLPVVAFIPSLSLPNTGNIGLPLCLFAFGERGLALGIGFMVTTAVMHFTLGAAMASGRVNFRLMLTTPVIWVIPIAIAMNATDTPVPEWIGNTTRLLGGLSIPLMLFALGASLASLRIANLAVSTYVGALRIGLGIGLGLLLTWVIPMDPAMRGVVILQASMPVAVMSYVMAARFGGPHSEIAGAVVVSTLLSFLVLPGLVLLVI